jgi:glycine cleavage system aminomethyltransferase T
MNYVGELGYEIFHPIESQISVFQTLMDAGGAFDLKMFGMYAMDSMRLEKGYLAWKSEMNVHHTPLETNVAWTVKMDKDFIGKAGLEKQKAAGVPRQLVCLVCQADDADPWGYNPIFNGEEIVGMTSSGGYGHRVERALPWDTCRLTWRLRAPGWKSKCWARSWPPGGGDAAVRSEKRADESVESAIVKMDCRPSCRFTYVR